MDEETFQKILSLSISQHASEAESMRDSCRKQLEIAQGKQRYSSEILQQISHALTSIIDRASRIPSEDRVQYYDKEIRNLDSGVTKILSSQTSDVARFSGALEMLDARIDSYERLKRDCLAEMGRAKEIKELQESGELGSPRQPGKRPQRIKDVRNYATEKTETE